MPAREASYGVVFELFVQLAFDRQTIQYACKRTHLILDCGLKSALRFIKSIYNISMLTVVIQAGGQSSRMGEDKALRPFLGRPLIQRVIERLASIADEIIVTTNRPDEYAFLKLRLISDLKPGRGALGGLYTAIASASSPFV